MKMKIITLEIGSLEWLKAFTASKAPAVMNESKYQSRNDLLGTMSNGVALPVSDYQQALFNKGHQAEDDARTILEMEELEDYPPVTGMIEIEGMKLISSYDGLAEGCKPWEHKLWNATLAENVGNNVLEPHYYWQLEHQMLVADVDSCVFTTSDGTEKNRASMIYESVPKRRAELIAGWKQMKRDLAGYQVAAKQEAVVANEVEDFPLIQFSVSGTELVSNITDCLVSIKERAAFEMSRTLETDQDFADKDKLNKTVKKARADLKSLVEKAKSEFVSFSDFSNIAVEVDSVLQKMQSSGEKQVKEAKEAKKQAIVHDAGNKLTLFITGVNELIKPLDILSFRDIYRPDWVSSMKGKRTIDSIQNAVDTELSKAQQSINEITPRIIANLNTLDDMAGDYSFLFTDVIYLAQQEPEALMGMITLRINDHQQIEADRLEKQREKIRQEEEAKAQAKIKAEQDEKDREERERSKPSQEKITQKPSSIQQNPETKQAETVGESKHSQEKVYLHQQLSEWAGIYKVDQDAMFELENILRYYGVNLKSSKAA